MVRTKQKQKRLRRGGKNTLYPYLDNHDGVVTNLESDILDCEVKWALGSISMNKASRGDGIPAELFQILKDDAIKVQHSICQQIWKTQQWPQDPKRLVFVPITKKGNAKSSSYCAIAVISYSSKVMLKILQARLQQYLNWEHPDGHARFRKGRETRDQIVNICWITEKVREFQENIYFCFIDYTKAFDCVDHKEMWNILKEMGVPDHLTCILRNLYTGQEATARTRHGTMDWFKTGKGVHQGCILSPAYLAYMQSACMLSRFSHIWVFATLWTIAHQAPPCMGFSRQEHWSGLPSPPPGHLPAPDLHLLSLMCWQAGCLPLAPAGKPLREEYIMWNAKAGWITNWNQDCREKYHPQLCWWYHS